MNSTGTYCGDWCATDQCERSLNVVMDKLINQEPVLFYVSKPMDCTEWTLKTNNQNKEQPE